ncbi:MAG: hypothetical protein WB507_12265 [Solirubrobacterales bacterium]
MAAPIKTISIYVRIVRTYANHAPSLLLLATVVFVPLGLLDAIAVNVEAGPLSPSNGLLTAAAAGAVVLLALTGLIGEVFYSGAVAVSLTHAARGRTAPLHEIARRLNYRRLITVDLLYGAIVVVGLLLLVVPGVAAFVLFGLSGPVVEIEGRSVGGALRRSRELVRGRFWTVLLVLGPIELVGDLLTDLLTGLVHHHLGHSLLGIWTAESLSNIVLTPIYAVAAVLLTLDLIVEKDGAPPRLHSATDHA